MSHTFKEPSATAGIPTFWLLLVVKNSTPFHAELYSEAVRSAVGETLVEEPNVESATKVQWKGTQYKKYTFCV